MKPTKRDEARIAAIVEKKVDLTTQIRELRVQLAQLNKDLVKAGADISEIAAW